MPCYDPYSTELYSESRTALAAPSRLTAINAAEQAFEREKAAITSYEQGWDRWDGPVWPLGYVQCRMRTSLRPSNPGSSFC